MKVLQSSFFRALCAVVVGVLLLKYHESTVTWISIAIGVLFFLSGIVSCAAYYVARKQARNNQEVDEDGSPVSQPKPTFPIVGVGSIILGVILALMPASFTNEMLYVLAAILILGGISQVVGLMSVRKFTHIGLYYWIAPMVVLLVGVVGILKPGDISKNPLLVVGWGMVLYGVVEAINFIKISAARRRKAKADSALLAKRQSVAASKQEADCDVEPSEVGKEDDYQEFSGE